MNPVDRFIRAAEAAANRQLRVHHKIRQRILRCLLRAQAANPHILKSVIGERRRIDIFAGLADINVFLASGRSVARQVCQIKLSVDQMLAVVHRNCLSCLGRHMQTAHARVVLAKIVQISIVHLSDGNRPQLLFDRNRFDRAENAFPARTLGAERRLPFAGRRTRQQPVRSFFPCVISLAHTVVIGQKRRRSGQKRLIRFQNGLPFLSAAFVQTQRKTRRAAKARLVKIPDIAARIVLKAVSKPDAEHVLSDFEQRRDIIGIIIDRNVG